jgi:hypothetical protein
MKMRAGNNELSNVTVKGHQVRAEQMGDTTQFHADAYKTHPDATAEDLVTKMPGVTSDNSGVKVNGESVQQVYVDGKPFFGTDPTLALRNLPSEIVDKIQVFDKLSDQSQFTGFDDGNSQKTMNIITKKNKSEGVFGKLYAGDGTDERNIEGGNVNIFDGNRRISIIGLNNNINQQNFSMQDILGVVGGSGGGRGGGGGGGGMFGGGAGGGSGASNFLVGQQSGITNTGSVGLNYSDNWGSKIKVTASYFYNLTNNTNATATTRNYFSDTTDPNFNVYQDNDNTVAKNWNQRFNLRFEYNMDSFNALTWTPSFSYQKNITNDSSMAGDTIGNKLASSTGNNTNSKNNGYTFSNNLLLQHKFKKPRRTISANFTTSVSEQTGVGTYYSANDHYYDTFDSSTLYNQQFTTYNNSYSVGTNITYTEPVGAKGQLMLNYNPNYTKSTTNKETDDYNAATGAYNEFDSVHSNKYESNYTTQKVGVNYRIGDRKLSLTAGFNVQYATLEGEQVFPSALQISRNYTDVLPIITFNRRQANGRNLRIMYRTNITPPSVTQLQNVVNISNPLLLSTGNISLRQDYEQTLIVRYGLVNAKSSNNFFIYGYANYINNYIGSLSIIPHLGDTLFNPASLHNPVYVSRGSQLSLPVNLNGYFNAKSFVTYGIPIDFVKSNLNLNGGISYTQTPGQINSLVNYSQNYAPTGGVVISSNVSEDLDFTLAYTGNYNIVQNTENKQANNNYYSHTASVKVNYIFKKRLVINTNFANSYYTAFSSTGIQNYNLWTSYIAYKFLKNKALEARLTMFDMLNQNKSISRTVTGTYVENDITQVLKQYELFQLTYTIRNFKGTAPADQNQQKPIDMNVPPQWQNFRGGGGSGGHGWGGGNGG